MTDFSLLISPPSVPVTSGTDIISYVRANTGISCFRGMDQIRQASPPIAGTFATKLDNIARNFSPGNTLSSFYPFTPPMNMRLTAAASVSETYSFLDGSVFDFLDGSHFESFGIPARDIWTGVYDDNDPHPELQELSLDLTALGNFSRLRDKVIQPTALYEGKTINELIDILLDLAGWPSDDRVLDVSSVTIPYWALNGDDAFDALVKLVRTDGPNALVYEDGSGRCVFKNNMARLTETTSTISQATFTAALGSDPGNIIAFKYTGRYKDKILAAQINQVEREVQPLDVIWSLGQALNLAVGQSKVFTVRGSDWFKGAVVPSPFGTNEVQVLTPSVVLTNGTFKAAYKGQETSDIHFNETTANIQAALEGLSTIGADNVICTGGPINLAPVYVYFRGALKEQAIDLITITSSLNVSSKPATINWVDMTDGPDTTYKLFPSAPLASGQFKIKNYLGNKTAFLGYNATAGQIQTAIELEPVIVPGDVAVSGGPIDTSDTTIVFQGALSGSAVPLSITDSNLTTNSDATATVVVTRLIKGGGPDWVSTGSVDMSLDRDNGAAVKLTVTNTDTVPIDVTGLQLRANLVSVARSNTILYPADFDPTTVKDGRLVTLDVLPEIPFADAETDTQEYFERYSVQRDAITLSVVKEFLDSSGNEQMLALSMISRVTIIEPQTGINTDYYVMQKRVFINPSANLTSYEYGCEQAA